MFGLGQPSRVAWGLYLLTIAACNHDATWSHDAGPAFDASTAPVWTFPPTRRDTGRIDRGTVEPADAAQAQAWQIQNTLPVLDGYDGDQRSFALTSSPDERPCVAFSGSGGLYFGCLIQLVPSDAGIMVDAHGHSDAGRTQEWQIERLAEQPNGAWVGAQIDATFDAQGKPWIVARQMPQRITHLYRYEEASWRHEEVPVAVGGIDPQLHFYEDTLILIHGSEENELAPALVMSQRSPEGEWAHRRLISGYDGQPGRWHHSDVVADQLKVCSFEPSEQSVTSAFVDLNPNGSVDAGNVSDGPLRDGVTPELLSSATVAGGPFCFVHPHYTLISDGLLGPIRRYRGGELLSATNRYGPFNQTSLNEEELILSIEDQRLIIGSPNVQGFDLGPWRAHDRPRLARVQDGIMTAVARERADGLELLIWNKLP